MTGKQARTSRCAAIPPSRSRLRGAGAALLVALVALAPAGCIRRPEVRLKDVEVGRISFRRIDLVWIFDVRNPNLFDARLYGFECTMTAAGEQIATGAAPEPIPKVPALGSETVGVATTVDFVKLGRVVRQVRRGKTIPYELAGRPVFNVLGLAVPVPFRHAGKIPRLQPPRWKLLDVALRRGARPAFLLTFEIENPGSLDLALEGVRGSLRLAGETVLQLHETSLTSLPGGKKVHLVVPVRLRLRGALGAAAKALLHREKLSFDGDFHLKTPVSLRRLLLSAGANK